MGITGMGNLSRAFSAEIISGIENDAFDYSPIFQQNASPPHLYVPIREYLEDGWMQRAPWMATKEHRIHLFLCGEVKESLF